jgi:hypothetical protein
LGKLIKRYIFIKIFTQLARTHTENKHNDMPKEINTAERVINGVILKTTSTGK